MSKILGEYNTPHTWKIHKHQGIGKLPGDLKANPNRNDRTLLHNFPSKLRAYGKSMGKQEVVVLLVDLDDRADCKAFKQELLKALDVCTPMPNLLIRIAIEELEAWYLGDFKAIQKAYPESNQELFDSYIQDSQCGTWEKLGEIISPASLKVIKNYGKRSVRLLEEKRRWAIKITPFMDIENNRSPSFCCFRDGLKKIANAGNGNSGLPLI